MWCEEGCHRPPSFFLLIILSFFWNLHCCGVCLPPVCLWQHQPQCQVCGVSTLWCGVRVRLRFLCCLLQEQNAQQTLGSHRPSPPLSVYLDLDVAVLTSCREEERLKERGQEGEGEGPKGGPSCGKETCPSVPLLWYGDGIQTRMCRGLCVHLSTYEGSPRLNVSC